MKSLIVLLVFLSSFEIFASPCSGEDGYYWTNYRGRPNQSRGGFISNEAFADDSYNNVFIGPSAQVCGSSVIVGDVKIIGKAVVESASISDDVVIKEDAYVGPGVEIKDRAQVAGDAFVMGSVLIEGEAKIGGKASVSNESDEFVVIISENARVFQNAKVSGNAFIGGKAFIMGNSTVKGDAVVNGNAKLRGWFEVSEGEISSGVHTAEMPEEERARREREERWRQEEERRRQEEERRQEIRRQKLAKLKVARDTIGRLATYSKGIFNMRAEIIGCNFYFKNIEDYGYTDGERSKLTIKAKFNLKRDIESHNIYYSSNEKKSFSLFFRFTSKLSQIRGVLEGSSYNLDENKLEIKLNPSSSALIEYEKLNGMLQLLLKSCDL